MSIENLPKLQPVELGYCLDAARPVIPLAMSVAHAGCHAPHQHPRGQLIYASRGLMWVVSAGHRWLVPPAQALWLPPGVEHQVFFPGQVMLRNLFVHPARCEGLPGGCAVLQVSELLRALLVRVTEIGADYAADGPLARLMAVLLDELGQAVQTPLQLPFSQEPRLLRVMNALLENPADRRRLEDWAAFTGSSLRTLGRLFERETGLSFSAWRQRLLLQTALERLAQGEGVTRVALALGYDSPSAFSSMFRRVMGQPPTAFIGGR